MEFAYYFGPNQPNTESDYDSEDMEEEVEYMTDDEVVMSEQEEGNHEYAQSTRHFKDEDDVDKWLNTEIKKHMSMQKVKSKKDALISIIKSIRQEMRDGIKKRQFEASTVNDEIAGPVSLSPDRRGLVKRWHVCKPIHVTYDDGSGEDYRMWPTCNPKSKFCFGYNEIFGVNEHGTLRQLICFRDDERRAMKGSYMRFADFLQILDSYDVEEEYEKKIGNPYSRRFDKYKKVFNNEIEQLSNEYILRIGKKGYVLDNEDEMWRIEDEKTDYDPPYVNIKTFEVKRYSFKGRRSFVCITDREDDFLPLERVNGARFKSMIRKEMEGSKYIHEET
ncbi:hypothetical protein Tco_1021367 [Tanacetum coccineum]